MPVSRVSEDIFELIGKSEDIEQASRAMKAIAHPLRLKVLCVLAGGEMPVLDIMEAVGTSQSNISQHLAILRDKKILKSRKDANRVQYRIADQRTLKLVGMMREVFPASSSSPRRSLKSPSTSAAATTSRVTVCITLTRSRRFRLSP